MSDSVDDIAKTSGSAGDLVREWVPFLFLLGLFVFYYRELLDYSSIAPVNESRDEGIGGQLFVPNQKPFGLIAFVSGAFLFLRRHELRHAIGSEAASRIALPLLVLALLIGTWSHYTGEPTLLLPSVSLALMGSAGVLGGAPALRAMRFPALLLLLALPIPGPLLNLVVHELQLWTASSVGALLSLIGIENVVSGETIDTRAATFWVIEGCSGLRAMETMFLTAIVYQALVPHSRWYSGALICISPIVGIIVNHLRVLAIILDPQAAAPQDHTAQGIVMIVLGTLLLAACGELLIRSLRASQGTRDTVVRVDVPVPNWPLRRAVVVVCLLLVGVAANQGDRWETARPEHKNPVRLPNRHDGWQGKAHRLDREYFGSTRHTQAMLRSYRREDDEALVFLAVDGRVRPLVSGISPKNESIGAGWKTVSREPITLEARGGLRAYASVQRNRGRYAYVVFWQHGRDGYLGESLRSVLALDRSPIQRPYDATAVRISTRMRGIDAEARRRAHETIEPLIELVLREFPAPATGD